MIWLWIQDFQNWKNRRNIDCICTIYFFLFFCTCVFGFFYDLQTIRIQCFGEKTLFVIYTSFVGNLSSAYRLRNTLVGNSPPKDAGEAHASTDTHTHSIAELGRLVTFWMFSGWISRKLSRSFFTRFLFTVKPNFEKYAWLSWKLCHNAKDLHVKMNWIFCNQSEMWPRPVRFTADEQRLVKHLQTHSPYHTRLERCCGLLTVLWSDADRWNGGG